MQGFGEEECKEGDEQRTVQIPGSRQVPEEI